jgi:hypothetical protein
VDGRVVVLQAVGDAPVRGRALAVQDAGGGEEERAGAEGREPLQAPARVADPVDERRAVCERAPDVAGRR